MENKSLIPRPVLPQITLPESMQKNHFIVALTAKRVMDCENVEIFDVVSAALEKAIFDMGLRGKLDEDIKLLKASVIAEVKDSFKTLTLEEIKSAIHNGSRGKYETEPQFGISVVRVGKWLAGYMSASERAAAKVELKKLTEPKPYEPTEAEKQALRKENVLKAWDYYKENKSFDDVGNAVYTTLDGWNLITFSRERKIEFMEQAKRNLRNFYDPVKQIGNIGKQNDYRKVLESLENNSGVERVKIEAKKIALNTFFATLLERKSDLLGLINSVKQS